jgi:DNA ligase-associated metallophosphoesterase
MIINFANHELVLHHAGIIYWPKYKIGIVSDLHLEKGSHFAKRGFFLPPYDSQDTLERLLETCKSVAVSRLIILGDCFHDPKGYDRLPLPARQLFDQLLNFDPVWIKGNHDGDFVPDNFAAYEVFEQENIIFRHQAIPGAINEISGHYHPKTNIIYKEMRIQRDCFVTDGKKLILPAFGAYTGGLAIDNPVIKNLLDSPVNAYILGEERIFHLKI